MFASKDLFFSKPSGYQISRSVRLRSSASAYFNRTPSVAGNQQKFTWSGWVKLGLLSDTTFVSLGTTLGVNLRFSSNQLQSNILTVGSTTSTAVYRDPSAWYHFVLAVDTTQASNNNRLRLYVNGNEVVYSANATITQNANLGANTTTLHALGAEARGGSASTFFDGYMTEVNYVDGQQLTPSSFGSTNATTGVWQPAKYTGTYGTNGFYLNFSSNGTSAALGTDFSGNSNTWTVNNVSVTAGVTYDSMVDSPTVSAVSSNYAVFNPLWQGRTNAPTNGNLDYPASSVGIGTMDVSQFSSYWEITSTGGTTTTSVYSTTAATTVGVTTGLTYGFRFNSSTGALDYTTNGSSFTSLATGLTSGPYFVYVSTATSTTASFNGGQRPFTYTPPTGFVALNTYNLPASTITNGAAYMAATTYTGNGSTQSITNTVGSTSFQPDFVWIKARSVAYDHNAQDSVRGAGNTLFPDLTSVESVGDGGITSFNTNGFSLNSNARFNNNTTTYVGWQWKASGSTVSNTNGSITSTVSVGATQGFSVVTYTGTGANATVGHGLGVAPKMVIYKNRSVSSAWIVYHSSLPSAAYGLQLNLTNAQFNDATAFNSTAPTSSVLSVGTNFQTNGSGNGLVAYCFSAVAGYSAFGSYTGNGSADGPFVYCGFRPRWIMVKCTSSIGNWQIIDTSRDTYNDGNGLILWPNLSNAETSFAGNRDADVLSNGFKLRGSDSDSNASGATYIYAAFAENPFKNSLAR